METATAVPQRYLYYDQFGWVYTGTNALTAYIIDCKYNCAGELLIDGKRCA